MRSLGSLSACDSHSRPLSPRTHLPLRRRELTSAETQLRTLQREKQDLERRLAHAESLASSGPGDSSSEQMLQTLQADNDALISNLMDVKLQVGAGG